MEEDHREECQRSSMVSTLLEVVAPGAVQRSGQPDAEEDHRGERR
jgi:hypothetical protein